MKRTTVILAVVMFAFAMILSPVMAGEKCSKSKEECAKTCLMSKLAKKTDEKAEAKHECIDKNGEAYTGKCADLVLDIEGMTCGGCEAKVKATLEKLDGVIHVKAVSHTDKMAEVCYNPENVKADLLISSVKELGYKVGVKSDNATTAASCAAKHAAEGTAKCAGHKEGK